MAGSPYYGHFFFNFLCLLLISYAEAKLCSEKYDLRPGAKVSSGERDFLNCWGTDMKDGESDTVILMDVSGSMGTFGYHAEVQFVEGLLSRIKVAFNATRVSIVSFSHKVSTILNYVTPPKYENHKCKFKKDFLKLRFTGGGTALRDALRVAGNIFSDLKNSGSNNRKRANKALIVISDGYGNYVNGKYDPKNARNVKPEMDNIKYTSRQIEVYTVALTKYSDQVTLRDKIATEKSLYLFMPGMRELALLAKNIRGDAYANKYQAFPLNFHECNNKCDANSFCGCNLITGDTSCACKRGYYGTAKRGPKPTCVKCPADTYGNSEGLILESECTKCPRNAITSGTGKKYKKDCICRAGFEEDPVTKQCERRKCSPLDETSITKIANKAECARSNFETQCVFKCINNQYELRKQKVLTCTERGKWNPEFPPQCKAKTCAVTFTKDSDSYTYKCKESIPLKHESAYSVDSYCNFQCGKNYYHHSGNKKITCLGNKKWSGDIIDCREIKCVKVPIADPESNKLKVVKGSKDCLNSNIKAGERCTLSCPEGYKFEGENTLLCNAGSNYSSVGTWSTDINKNPPKCKDNTSPTFEKNGPCDKDKSTLKFTTLPGKPYAVVNFQKVKVTDNSGETPTVVADPPKYEFGKSYNISWTLSKGMLILFIASDKAGNKAVCSITVIVLDEEPPKVLKCPDPIEEKTTTTTAKVTWVEPTFIDNCGSYATCPVTVNRPAEESGTDFELGSKIIRYTAMDKSGNNNTDCKFRVTVKKQKCGRVEAPENAAFTFYSSGNMLLAACNKKTVLIKPWPKLPMYTCSAQQKWVQVLDNSPISSLSPCLKVNSPNAAKGNTTATFTYEGNCNDEATKKKIKETYGKLIGCYNTAVPPCELKDLEVWCGKVTAKRRRKRRALSGVYLKATYILPGKDEEAKLNSQQNLVNLKNEMREKLGPKIKNTISNIGDVSKKILTGMTLASVSSVQDIADACKYDGEIENNLLKTNEKCYQCPPGEFKNKTTNNCQQCPSGSVQPFNGQVACNKCPKGEDTQGKDKGSMTSCQKYCLPGSYSPNGLLPCFLCPVSTYTNKPSTKTCKKCPVGTITILEGRKSVHDCGSACQPGTYSDNGIEPCHPCPRGYYTSDSGQVVCKECPAMKSTYGEGSFSLKQCFAINYCASNPCTNGKHCINYRDSYHCECQKGFYGPQCDKEIDDCALKPCMHGGKCIDEFRNFNCLCKAGTDGKQCQHVYKTCKVNICGAHGVCKILADATKKCVCSDGYTGKLCEGRISGCSSSPCQHEGTCLDNGKGDFYCQCPIGYKGKICEEKVHLCASKPCQNGGNCVDGTFGYTCSCPAGFGGLQCQTRYDMCLHTPCKNKGICKSLVNNVECQCPAGYGGKYCETKLSGDYDISFQARTSPTFLYIKGRHRLTSFTVAFWMRTSDRVNTGTPISYAVKSRGKLQDNALVITNYNNFDLTINNVTASLGFSANDGEWHHVAVTWQSSTGRYTSYLDGVPVPLGSGILQINQVIEAGGIFVVGEEQDELGGHFTPTESFFGDLSQLHVWNNVLSKDKVYDLASSCKHTQGNTVAWADFSNQHFEGMYITRPSLGCDFSNYFREFQYLKESLLPSELETGWKRVISGRQTAENCASICMSTANRKECRSFTHNRATQQCVMYSKSLLTDQGEPRLDDSFDLYQVGCVRDLGMSSREISDSAITASSYEGNAMPKFGRLLNTPAYNSKQRADWQPRSTDRNSYIQINFKTTHRITGIATQGSSFPEQKMWVKSYKLSYLSGNRWFTYSANLPGNIDTDTVKTNRVYIETKSIRLHPLTYYNKPTLRMEIYGCKQTPQGVPDRKQVANFCSNTPCRNRGTCYSLSTGFDCVCRPGYTGRTCEIATGCGPLDIPINGKILKLSKNFAIIGCKQNFNPIRNGGIFCLNGLWTGVSVMNHCQDIDECKKRPCGGAQCRNLMGGYRCECSRGYMPGLGNRCVSVNECARNNGGCDDKCMEVYGGYKCLCTKPGFRLHKGHTCLDIDECAEGKHRCSHGCENTAGGFHCICNHGYHLSSDGRSCVHVGCPSLTHPAHGRYSITGEVATYVCNPGYKLIGSSKRNCLPTAVWSGSNPACIPVKCMPLAASKISMSYSGNRYGSKATFSCTSNYRLFGSATLQCTGKGEWSAPYPRCVMVYCPILSKNMVINGQVVGVGNKVGSTVKTVCNEGYKLREAHLAIRTCLKTSSWSSGNSAVAHCDIVDCGNPIKTSNYVNIVLRSGTKYGSRASYHCSQSSGQRCLSGPIFRICGKDGKWSGEDPTCVPKSCCTPPVPKNSKLYWEKKYTYGARAFISCNKGYATGGTDYRICKTNGQWSGKKTTCTIKDCGDPGSITNGVRFGDKTLYNYKLRYYCKPGYKLIGSPVRVCGADGKWTGTRPACHRSKDCGGHILKKSGNIKYAGKNVVCHWLIQVTQGKKVTIEFMEYNLTEKERLQIFDYRRDDEASYKPFLTFSQVKPKPLTSTINYMRIIYIGGETYSGFSFKFFENDCGGFSSERSGEITSPGYPIGYPPKLDCYWTVFCTFDKLTISFQDFSLLNYNKDYAEILSNPSEESEIIVAKSYGRISPQIHKDYVKQTFWIHFHSDPYHSGKGFYLFYYNYIPRKVT